MRPYTWRQAIQKSKLPATTKFVLLNLACYINDSGQAAFPSIQQQADDTGLSKRAVITHLKGVEGQWLCVSKHGYAGQKWARNEYLPRLPDEPDLDVRGLPSAAPDVGGDGVEGGERGSPPFAETLGKGGERGSPPSDPEGGERDDTKVVNDVHSNRPVEQTINPRSPQGGDLLVVTGYRLRRWFDAVFWPKYPKPVKKAKAMDRLEELRPDDGLLEAITQGLDHRLAAERHAKARGAFFRAWPDAHRWLRDRGWEDRFDVPRETSHVPRCQCGAIGVVGDGRRWWCSTHNPDRRPD